MPNIDNKTFNESLNQPLSEPLSTLSQYSPLIKFCFPSNFPSSFTDTEESFNCGDLQRQAKRLARKNLQLMAHFDKQCQRRLAEIKEQTDKRDQARIRYLAALLSL
ncbi:MAG: hypothetical protein LBV23_01345 [Deltaproteobacteria bacterium]|jgi:hypothetical protein|nr:hypothetical protein [Deltaproteobacteria bacterium]